MDTSLDPVLVSLGQQHAVTRLDRIAQCGAAALIGSNRQHSRLEHSWGVAALVRRVGGSVEEQAAGLVHDGLTLALSHTLDGRYALADELGIMVRRARMALMDRLRSTVDALDISPLVLSPLRWRILDVAWPDVCADRMDYLLRDSVAVGLIAVSDAEAYRANMRFVSGQLVVGGGKAGINLSELFWELYEHTTLAPREAWVNAHARAVCQRMAALGELSFETLALDDTALVLAARASSLRDEWCRIEPSIRVHEVEAADAEYSPKIERKWLDPLVEADGHIRRTSEISHVVEVMRDEVQRRPFVSLHLAASPRSRIPSRCE